MRGQRRTGTCTDGILARGKNNTMPFAAPCMILEVIRQIVLSQKAKDTCPIISLIGLS